MTTTVLALDSDFWNTVGRGVGAMWLYAAVGLVLMVVGFYAIDLATPGPLRQMVKQGKPNAVIISAAGIVSMAFIVVLAIYGSGGKLAEGLISTAVFGLVGIAAQVIMMRVATTVLGVDMSGCLHSAEFRHPTLMVAAAQFALGLVVAVAIL
ncbi:DUF350 domain-containing protein [Mycobacterium sp. NPDC048908]|uniref:DUF350 domain-containing protein n=1 Tax=Mycobacterium sp. NPDC048908 TaxID=3364292 RepID=UPI0037173441